ncbi:MAG: GIY-YIG nuclease family protein [Chloroflexi bacterium]|nr:GIY-YIG nuclease family protein [Chloroflexota bacterium]
MTSDETQATDESGIVYAATNPKMPGLVKIGGTSRANVQARMDELYSTGVPAPFKCAIARRVDRYHEVESALHAVFEPSRVSPGREFFEVTLDQVAAALGLAGGEDVTSQRDDDEVKLVVGQTVVDKDDRHGVIEKITKAMFHLRDPENGELFSRFQIRPASDPPPLATSPNSPDALPSENEQS